MQKRVAYPEWTDYKKKNGLDPLAMQNGSINLYQRLLPGISNVTLRIRYYGLYAWLATVYAQREGHTNIASWQRTIRRAEALYALVASHHQDDAGVAGSRWAGRNRSASTIRFSDNADPGAPGTRYLKQAWGAYGAAYGSQLLETGVLCPAEGHAIPVPSAEFGDALARAFAEGAGDLADRYYNAIQRGNVTQNELEAFAPLLPSSIGEDSAERQLYEELLFARGKLQRPADLNRRETLLMLLKAAAHLQRRPDVKSARWLLYAGCDEQGRAFTVTSDALRAQQERWWVYQANDLLHFGYETLLKFSLDTLESYPSGMSLATLIGGCVSQIEQAAPSVPTTWKQFVAEAKPAPNPSDGSDKGAEARLADLAAVGAGENEVCPPESAWAALKLIAVVWQRARVRADLIGAELGGLDREGFHSLVTEGTFLASIEELNFSEALARLIEQRVIKRHLWVAHRKFRHQGDYTFLIEADDGLVRLRATSGPVFTNPRMGPALGFLADLHLIGDAGLSALGRRLVAAS